MALDQDIQDAINTGTDQAFTLVSPGLQNINRAANNQQEQLEFGLGQTSSTTPVTGTQTSTTTGVENAQPQGPFTAQGSPADLSNRGQAALADATTGPNSTTTQAAQQQIQEQGADTVNSQQGGQTSGTVAGAQTQQSTGGSNTDPDAQSQLTGISDTRLLEDDPRIQPDIDPSAGSLDRFKRVADDRIFEQRGNQLVEVTDPNVKQKLSGVALDAFANVDQAASTVKKGFAERGINADTVDVIEGNQNLSSGGQQALQQVGADRLQTAAQETQQALTAARPSSGQSPEEAQEAINNLPAGGRNLTPEEIQAIASEDFIDDATRQQINDTFQPITGRTTESFTVGETQDEDIPDFDLSSGSTVGSTGLGGDVNLDDVETEADNFLERLNTIQANIVEETTPSETEVELRDELRGVTQAARQRRESARNRLAPQFAIKGELGQIDRQEAIRRQGIAEDLQAEIDRRSTRVDALKQQLQFNKDNLSTLATLQKLTTPETISTKMNDQGDVFAIQRDPQSGAVTANQVGRIPVEEKKDYAMQGTFKTATGQRAFGVNQDGTIDMFELSGAQGFQQESGGTGNSELQLAAQIAQGDGSRDEKFLQIRNQTGLGVTETNKVLDVVAQKNAPQTPEAIADAFVSTTQGLKDRDFSESEARNELQAQIKDQQGLSKNDPVPPKYEELIEESLNSVYGTGVLEDVANKAKGKFGFLKKAKDFLF